jgi:putative exosortase-associated protein (TIGR04073 family)
MFMCKSFSTFAPVLLIGFLAAGCAGPEQKLGRGMRNVYEVVRGGEMRRAKEQSALFYSPDEGYTTGFVKGFNRSLARTGLGLYEIVTAPIPPYDPIWTNYLKPNPVYPDCYKPRLKSDSTYATDTSLGFGGGDIAPLIPGSRFHIFDN